MLRLQVLLTQLSTLSHICKLKDAMVAQAKAIAVQSLTALPCFTGEGSDITDDEFEKWLEQFRKQAKFVGLRANSCII